MCLRSYRSSRKNGLFWLLLGFSGRGSDAVSLRTQPGFRVGCPGRQTGRQTDRQTGRQAGRQTGRQAASRLKASPVVSVQFSSVRFSSVRFSLAYSFRFVLCCRSTNGDVSPPSSSPPLWREREREREGGGERGRERERERERESD